MSDETVSVTVAHEFAHDPETLWLVMSDPASTEEHLSGCESVDRVEGEATSNRPDGAPVETLLAADQATADVWTFDEGERYRATVGVPVGDLTPDFEFDLEVAEHDFPRIELDGDADARLADLDVGAVMTFEETDEGVRVTWRAEAEVGGAVAERGAEALKPAVRPVPEGFFESVEATLAEHDAA
jgi:carbon monoxide dehydrogenase subunit G